MPGKSHHRDKCLILVIFQREQMCNILISNRSAKRFTYSFRKLDLHVLDIPGAYWGKRVIRYLRVNSFKVYSNITIYFYILAMIHIHYKITFNAINRLVSLKCILACIFKNKQIYIFTNNFLNIITFGNATMFYLLFLNYIRMFRIK